MATGEVQEETRGMTFDQQSAALRLKARKCSLLIRKLPHKKMWRVYFLNRRGNNRNGSIYSGAYAELLVYLDHLLFGKGKGRLPFV